MKYTSTVFFVLILILLGCNKEASLEVLKTEEPRANQVVIIFENPVVNGFYTIPESNGRTQRRTRRGDEIQYIDDQYIPRRESFNLNGEKDTVIIKTKRDFLEVQLMYKGVDDLRYIFKNGDTVEIKHQGIKPIAEIKNRNEDFSVTNFALVIRDSIAKDDYRATMIVEKPIMLTHRYESSNSEEFTKNWREIISTASKNVATEIKIELDLLDSLFGAGLMSQEQLSVHVISIYSELQRTLSMQKKELENSVKPYFSPSIDLIENRYPSITNNRQDSLLYLMDYNKAMTMSVKIAYNKKVGRVKRERKGAGISIINYARLYDSIRVSNELSPIEKKIIQYSNVNGILQNRSLFGIESQLIYLTRFKNDFEDSLLVAEIKAKYQVKFEIEDEIKLESEIDQSTTLESIIAANEGKVIYLDFWASWCAPCIKEMPSSKSVSSNYEDKDVVFIYISMDRRKKDWQKAIEKHQLNTGQHYRITNANNSKGFEDLNIPFIPRYMIYDKEGKLVNNDAPRPSEANLFANELSKYLIDQK